MSKIGKKPILIPAGVETNIQGNTIKIKGPKGELSYNFPTGVIFTKEENTLVCAVDSQEKWNLWGLTRTLVANMVEGVTQWYEKKLLVIGVGYTAKKEGNGLILSLWLSHKVKFEFPKGIEGDAEQDAKGNYVVTLRGIDKQQLWEVAANLRALRTPEPYKGKGIRYIDEVVKLKAGKTAKK